MSDEVKRVVYTITHDFARYRKLDILNDPSTDPSKMVKDLDQNGFLRIDAVNLNPRGIRKDVIILVLDEHKKYSHNSPELKKLLGSVDSEAATKDKTLNEVILVVAIFESKKNLLDVVKLYQQREVRGPDITGKSAFYTLIYYRNLKHCIPEHVGVPKHTLMNSEEIQELCGWHLKTIKDFPLIPHTDPQILWIGGRTGQMVRLDRDSDTTCIYYSYRTII